MFRIASALKRIGVRRAPQNAPFIISGIFGKKDAIISANTIIKRIMVGK